MFRLSKVNKNEKFRYLKGFEDNGTSSFSPEKNDSREEQAALEINISSKELLPTLYIHIPNAHTNTL